MTKSFFLLAAPFLLTSASVAAAAEQRPNILFIFSDDHAPTAIGAYGGPLAALDPTPNIDRLAAGGTLFRNSFCTNSICGPSRAVVLTGKHSHINGFLANDRRFDPTQWVFPKSLQAVGYRTAIIGKWHLGCDPEGFDFWRVLPGQGRYYNPRLRSPDGVEEVPGHCTQVVTDIAIDWLDEHRASSEGPFLVMCQHKAPHRNWMPDPRDLQLYAGVEIPEPPTLFDDFADNASPAAASEMSIRTHMHPNYDLFLDAELTAEEENFPHADRSGKKNLEDVSDEQLREWGDGLEAENRAFNEADPTGDNRVRAKYQRYMKNYLRTVRGVDRSVGQLLDYLDKSGLADSTIVVYSSDQGFYLGEHGWFDKRWMYEPSLAMPLIVRWPGVTRPGTIVEAMVQNLDYAPTFLEAAGAEVPDAVQGRSLIGLLGGSPPTEWRDAIYYHYYGHPDVHNVARHRGVRTETHKLIHFYQLDEWELYDLVADPNEMDNLYGQPEYATLTVELKAELERLVEQYTDDSLEDRR
ncbi:MAG: sulfatase [Planctomycetota bacterium]